MIGLSIKVAPIKRWTLCRWPPFFHLNKWIVNIKLIELFTKKSNQKEQEDVVAEGVVENKHI